MAAALMAAVFAVLVPAAVSRTSADAFIDNAEEPVWSPDSRLIAFVYTPRWNSPDRVGPEIDTLDPITGRQRVAVAPFPAGTWLYGLDWSAGGRDLLFSECCPQNVWISRLDGRAPTLLVPGGRDARWSPDGAELAFISAEEQLEVMHADGSLRRVLEPARVLGQRTFGRRIAWAPNANRIAYVSGGDLFVYSFSDRRASRLTATATIEDNPVWAPDGSLIAYTRGPDHVVVRPDGTGQKVLYDDPDPDEGGANPLSWAPDSRHMTFSRDRVWIVSRTGARRPAIDRGFASDANAQVSSWSPDGRRIAYIATRMCPGPLPNALAVADVSLRRARFLTANCVRRGTKGADSLRGTSQNELLYGFRGDDVIRAAGGSDVVQGGRGNDLLDSGRGQVSDCGRYCDVLQGGPGDDIVVGHEASSRLDGGLGRDRLVGGPGYDLMLGGRGIDHVSAGGGRDSIHVRDGFRDYVRCGRDADFVVADSQDLVAQDCERVRRRQPLRARAG